MNGGGRETEEDPLPPGGEILLKSPKFELDVGDLQQFSAFLLAVLAYFRRF